MVGKTFHGDQLRRIEIRASSLSLVRFNAQSYDETADAPRQIRSAEMAVPPFGSVEFRALVELQKQICFSLVIVDRLNRIDANRKPVSPRTEGFDALQGMNDYALIMHLDRLRRWAILAKRRNMISRDFGKRLRAISRHIVFLRGKREHSEEYLEHPRRSKFLTRETAGKDCAFLTPADWSSTIAGVRRLGGKLVVADVEPALRELLRELTNAKLWLLPWKPEDLIETDRGLSSESL